MNTSSITPIEDDAINKETAEIEHIPGDAAHETHRKSVRDIVVLAVSILTILLTLRYIVWRTAITDWNDWWLSIPLIAAEIFTAIHILGYQYTIWPRKEQPIVAEKCLNEASVYIFIPTVNEGDEILEPTVQGAIEARKRFLSASPGATVRIIICNDGRVAGAANWEAAEALAEKYGIECVTRTVGGGAKAGNIENARKLLGAVGDSLIVVLDADQIAEPDFLLRTIPSFADSSVGWVQTRQYYRNQDNRVARWAEYQASLFYDFVCPGKSAANSCFICGTNVVIRAEALDQIGGFPQDSITEDFAASIRAHHQWRSVYIKDVLAKGLGPLDVTAYFVQQSRWARGTIGVFFSDCAKMAFGNSGLSMRQRIQYALSGTHYFCGLRDFIFLSCAVLCLATDHSPVKTVQLSTFAWYLLPYIAASQLLLCLQAGFSSVVRSTVIGYSSFPTLFFSLIEAISNRRVPFIVTPKSQAGRSDLRAVVPHLLIVAICAGVLIHASAIHMAWTVVKCIPFFWVCYALAATLPVFGLAKVLPGK
jgi:cellulose synthase (UDP-forming)